MSLNFLADYLWFFVYGLLVGYFIKLWQITTNKFPLSVLLLYTHGLWLVLIVLWIIIQLDSIQAWCAFGVAVFFAYLIPLPRISLAYFKKKRTEVLWQKQARKWQKQREREHVAYQQQAQFKFWDEQLRREQQGRANQAWQEGARQNQNKKQGIRPDGNQDKRSYEQILHLSAGWTQEDLKKAYQKEAQRTHPDKWVGKPEHLRKQMEAEYKVIQKAYKNLKRKRIIRD